jgi:hypothetical protein
MVRGVVSTIGDVGGMINDAIPTTIGIVGMIGQVVPTVGGTADLDGHERNPSWCNLYMCFLK